MKESDLTKRLSRLTHEPPQGCYEALHNTAYVKDREVYLRDFGDGGEDITLCRYCADQCYERCGIDLSDVTTEDFCDYMDCDCPVSVLYMVAVGAAGMREKLMAFEDAEERSQQ